MLSRPFRNGWTSNMSVAILRHSHHENCAKNMTGFIIHSRETPEELCDAYCYDDKGDYVHRKWLHFLSAVHNSTVV